MLALGDGRHPAELGLRLGAVGRIGQHAEESERVLDVHRVGVGAGKLRPDEEGRPLAAARFVDTHVGERPEMLDGVGRAGDGASARAAATTINDSAAAAFPDPMPRTTYSARAPKAIRKFAYFCGAVAPARAPG